MSTYASSGLSPVPRPEPTPYEIIGGTPTIRSAVDRLYFWISRDDVLFNRYFRWVNLGALKAHMVSLLSMTLGGPGQYAGKDMRTAHANIKGPDGERVDILAEHYDRVCDYVEAALLVEHCPRPILAAVQGVLAENKPIIVGAGSLKRG